MAKVVTISVRDADYQIWQQFKEICTREGTTASHKVMEFVVRYVERHSKNPAVPLTTWLSNAEYRVFPTLGEPPDYKRLREFPKTLLAELRDNAKAYYDMSASLLTWLSKHENTHKPLGIKEVFCPFCEG